MNIAFATAKNGGATTAMLAVAAVWPPQRQVVAVELDPSGGDIAIRFGLPGDPGLVSLAAAARRLLSTGVVIEHAQQLPGGLPVVVAPASMDQARAAIRTVAPSIPALADEDAGVDFLFDCGRLGAGAAADSVAQSATLTVLVARPTAEEVAHLRCQLDRLRAVGAHVALVLVGDHPYGAAEVGAFLGADVVGVLAVDTYGAGLLCGRGASPRSLRRTPLIATAGPVAHRLSLLAGRVPAPTDPASSTGRKAVGGDTPSAAGGLSRDTEVSTGASA